jgi:hypothetical protein
MTLHEPSRGAFGVGEKMRDDQETPRWMGAFFRKAPCLRSRERRFMLLASLLLTERLGATVPLGPIAPSARTRGDDFVFDHVEQGRPSFLAIMPGLRSRATERPADFSSSVVAARETRRQGRFEGSIDQAGTITLRVDGVAVLVPTATLFVHEKKPGIAAPTSSPPGSPAAAAGLVAFEVDIGRVGEDEVVGWDLRVSDAENAAPMYVFAGQGSFPSSLAWEGRDVASGAPIVSAGQRLYASWRATFASGHRVTAVSRVFALGAPENSRQAPSSASPPLPARLRTMSVGGEEVSVTPQGTFVQDVFVDDDAVVEVVWSFDSGQESRVLVDAHALRKRAPFATPADPSLGAPRTGPSHLRGENPRTDPTTVSPTLVLSDPFAPGGGTTLVAAAQRDLRFLAETLSKQDQVLVYAHGDRRGGRAERLLRSMAQAERVKQFLLQEGLVADQVIAVGKGADEPLFPDVGPRARRKNRRVELFVERPDAKENVPVVRGGPRLSAPRAENERSASAVGVSLWQGTPEAYRAWLSQRTRAHSRAPSISPAGETVNPAVDRPQ